MILIGRFRIRQRGKIYSSLNNQSKHFSWSRFHFWRLNNSSVIDRRVFLINKHLTPWCCSTPASLPDALWVNLFSDVFSNPSLIGWILNWGRVRCLQMRYLHWGRDWRWSRCDDETEKLLLNWDTLETRDSSINNPVNNPVSDELWDWYVDPVSGPAALLFCDSVVYISVMNRLYYHFTFTDLNDSKLWRTIIAFMFKWTSLKSFFFFIDPKEVERMSWTKTCRNWNWNVQPGAERLLRHRRSS